MNDKLLNQVSYALAVAYDVLSKHRLVGLDQNPRGVIDLVGSAHLALAMHQFSKHPPTSGDPPALNAFEEALLKAVGAKKMSPPPIISTNGRFRIYIQFNGDGEGRALAKFLVKHKIKFQQGSAPRVFKWVDQPALERALSQKG
jgi:hypothetical protein